MATTDLRTSSPVPSKPSTPLPPNNPAAIPPQANKLTQSGNSPPIIQQLRLPVQDSHGGSAHGILHLPPHQPSSKTAVILLSGAGGGITGPSGLYLSLATKLPTLTTPIPTLRLDYRHPARTTPCVADTKAAMSHLTTHHAIKSFILIGWSFGGAPTFTLAGRDERVIAAATVASQTADALKGAREAGRRGIPVLLCHGTGDRTLRPQCSEYLHEAWFEGYKGPESGEEKAKLMMFEGDDHALTRNASRVEQVMVEFVVGVLGQGWRVGIGRWLGLMCWGVLVGRRGWI